MTDYALYSEFLGNVNSTIATTASKTRVREMLAGMSRLAEERTGRRFDHRQEFIYQNTRRINRDGGQVDVDNGGRLILRGDLISVSEVLNNETEVVDPSLYDLWPYEDSARYKSEIHLASGNYWTWVTKPGKGAKVTGVWGWGGRWKNVTTLSAPIDAAVLAVPLTSVTGLEMRQILRIDNEYLLIDGEVTTSPITTERAVNGSAAASHLVGAAVALFQPDPLVRRLVIGLCKWQSELDDNPLLAEVTIGDATETVDLSQAPKWARDLMELLSSREDIGVVQW
jgi:hypothetical protein